MQQGILSHLGQETELSACGRTWRVARLSLAMLDEFFAWARTQLPDPLEVAHKAVSRLAREEHALTLQLEALPEGDPKNEKPLLAHLLETNRCEQKHLTTLALEKGGCFLSFGSPETQSVMMSVRGQCRLLWHVLRPHQDGVTEEDAYAILMELGAEAVRNKLDVAGLPTKGAARKNAEAPPARAA